MKCARLWKEQRDMTDLAGQSTQKIQPHSSVPKQCALWFCSSYRNDESQNARRSCPLGCKHSINEISGIDATHHTSSRRQGVLSGAHSVATWSVTVVVSARRLRGSRTSPKWCALQVLYPWLRRPSRLTRKLIWKGRVGDERTNDKL